MTPPQGESKVPGALAELARLHGVMPSYEESGGSRRGGPVHHASAEALVGVLGALGVPVDSPDRAAEAVRERRAELERALLPPVVVVWSNDTRGVTLGAGTALPGGSLECRLDREDGEPSEWTAPAGGPLRIVGPVPYGYHRLTVRAGAREATSWIVCAPPTTWEPEDDAPDARHLGAFLPLYALRAGAGRGTGDLGDLRALLEWSAARRLRFVGTLPLTAAFLGHAREPFSPGPYAPASRLFWNELFLDLERAPGLADAPEARSLLASEAFRRDAAALEGSRRVDYRGAARLVRPVIQALADALSPEAAPLGGPLAGWADAHPLAAEYARFRARTERLGAWGGWPEGSGAAAADATTTDHADERAFRWHLYAQWAMAEQMAGLAEGDDGRADASSAPARRRASLYLDLPLGAHADGFDTWRWPEAFVRGLSGGAPPDAFQEEGQDWGFPPLHPERTREGGHEYLRRSLRRLMRPAGMLRLDHVMSLHRLWCVPRGHSPTDGAYVRYPSEELYAILCLESHRCRCEIVGEDLGTVPEQTREAMERHRLRRMFVLPFELDARKGTVARPHPLSVASVGTHDLPPFAAWWTAADVDRREARGEVGGPEAARQREERARWREALLAVAGPPYDGVEMDVREAAATIEAREGLRNALALLAASPARHLLVNLEDLWGETESQNVPGTLGEENWTLRVPRPLEAWGEVPGLEETLARLSRIRREAKGWQTEE